MAVFVSSPGVVEHEYMFIDGGYLDQCLQKFFEYWCAGDRPQINYSALAGGFRKVFYYDALPQKRKEESQDDFDSRHDAKVAFFDQLRAISGWHVHLGISKRYIGEKAQQKEVDVLLAVDMLSHTYRKNMSKITFLAGDQDFRPLLDAVVRDGMYVTLMYDKAHTSVDLINMADARRELDFYGYYSFLDSKFLAAHPAPTRSMESGIHNPPDGVLNAEGYRDGELVARLWHLLTSKSDQINGAVPIETNMYPQFRLQGNLDFLKRVYTGYYGPVDWRLISLATLPSMAGGGIGSTSIQHP